MIYFLFIAFTSAHLSHDMEEKKKRMGIKKGVPLNSNLC